MAKNSGKSSKAARREAAQAQAAALKAKQEAAERRSKIITFGALGAVLLALIVVVIVVLFTGGDDVEAIDPGDGTVSVARDDFGIVVGPGGVAGGAEVPGVPEVGVYLDYTCGFCYRLEMVTLDTFTDHFNNGTANIVMYPVSILGADSARIAAASVWVAEHAPERWFNYHVAIFVALHSDGRGISNSVLAEVALEEGVPDNVAAGIRNGTAAATFTPWVDAATQAFVNNPAVGQPATPAIMLNGVQWSGDWLTEGILAQAILDAG
ncbi:MAG: disulfide bond formation protein DsbA [Promicromonosporaceae bacterium]|nr:disulfide bond formation protein DsbA [Promicromonosporaceae bacterium]